jgi:hypothetical protein
VAGDLVISVVIGGVWGWFLAVVYLRWADNRERSRFGDYVYKRYEDGKVTRVVPMTAEQRAAYEKVFADADLMFENIGKNMKAAFRDG